MAEQASSEHSRDLLARLEQELATATGQLEDYQSLIDQMPEIFEAKFTQQLHHVARDIRSLNEEHKRLQQEINHLLMADGSMSSALARQGSSDQSFKSFFRLFGGWRSWRGRGLVACAAALVTAVFAGLLLATFNRQYSGQDESTTESPSAPPLVESRPALKPSGLPQIHLRANGEVWLELRSPGNSLVFESTLKPGQQLSFPLAYGMRIRSGRPHLLDMALNDQPFTRLGAANDYSWRTIKDPERSPQADPEIETRNKP